MEASSLMATAVNARKVVCRLVAMRVAKGISQSRMAKLTGFSKAKISRIECGYDDDLKFSYIAAYSKGLGIDLVVTVTPSGMDIESASMKKRG